MLSARKLSNGDPTLNLSLEDVSSKIEPALDGASIGVKGSLSDVSSGIKGRSLIWDDYLVHEMEPRML
eukprot:scaffold12749_cov107-Cylindrotheca_fusiformis.AAC.2